jgi:two-component system sensor histidine kinase PilS (NtrC family)
MIRLREDFPRTRTVIIGRMLVAVSIVLTAVIGGSEVTMSAMVVLGVIAAALTAVYFFWHSTGVQPRLLIFVQCAVDVVFITVVAHFSGGLASPFKLLYFLPVIVASGRLGTREGVAVASGAVLGHFVLAATGRVSWFNLFESGALAEIITLLVALVLVAALEGHLARKASENEEQLETARSELDTAQLRIANILDSMGSGLVLVDGEGKVVYLNQTGQSILGLDGAAASGKDYRIVLAEVPAFCEHISGALSAGRPEVRADLFVRGKSGGTLPVGLSTSILRDDDGNDRGVIAIFQDLTEARRLEERLRHDDRLSALGEFAAGVAHEIRNPLYAIKGSVDLLKESVVPGEETDKLIALVSRESDRLNGLLQDVLQYGRMESGERESTRLDLLVGEVAELVRSHPSMKPEIELETGDAGPVESVVNPEQMRRAVLNLAINAVEAIDGAGSVRLSVVPEGDFSARGLAGGAGWSVALLVEDTGPGIPADKRDEIFQPFRTTKKGGTGLGLAIVDKAVQAHGGRIKIVSEPGKGSRFIIYLPA